MEWVSVLLLICSGNPDSNCQEKMARCVNWVHSTKPIQDKNLDKFDVATMLLTNSSFRKDVCD